MQGELYEKHKQTILPLLLLTVLLLVGLCDRAYAEESAQYPYLTSFEVVDVKFTSKIQRLPQEKMVH